MIYANMCILAVFLENAVQKSQKNPLPYVGAQRCPKKSGERLSNRFALNN
jgi:hypothetical protein